MKLAALAGTRLRGELGKQSDAMGRLVPDGGCTLIAPEAPDPPLRAERRSMSEPWIP